MSEGVARGIEVWDAPEAAWGLGLPKRLEALGWKPRVVTSPAGHARGAAPCALILNALLPMDWLQACMAVHHKALQEGILTALVVGRSLPEARRVHLREAGVSLFLAAPFSQAALRFQTNRAFMGLREAGPPRREARAPLRMALRARSTGREKAVAVYTLSPGGAFLETGRPWVAGMHIEIDLPGPEGITAVASEVRHTNVPGNCMNHRAPIGMGVKFERLEPAHLQAVEEAVRRTSAALLL